jgi:hypothetical protein
MENSGKAIQRAAQRRVQRVEPRQLDLDLAAAAEAGDEDHLAAALGRGYLEALLQRLDLHRVRRDMHPQAGGDRLDGLVDRFGVIAEEAHLAVAGLGADPDRDGLARLEDVAALAQRLGREQHLVFAGRVGQGDEGEPSRRLLGPLLAAADHPGHAEGLGGRLGLGTMASAEHGGARRRSTSTMSSSGCPVR